MPQRVRTPSRTCQTGAMALQRMALTAANLDWAATKLQNQEDSIQQFRQDLKGQQRMLLDALTRIQMLEQRLACSGRSYKRPESTQHQTFDPF